MIKIDKKKAIPIVLSTMIVCNSVVYANATNMDDVNLSPQLQKIYNETKMNVSKQKLQDYVNSRWDLLGFKGEKLYFDLREDYAQGSKLKELEFDIKTLGNQFRMVEKNYQDNDIIYDGLLITAGVSKVVTMSKVSKTKKVMALNKMGKVSNSSNFKMATKIMKDTIKESMKKKLK